MMDKTIDHGKIAEEFFRSGMNCSQSVVAAFEDVTGFDRETSLKAAAALGGGMCRLREVCGAVSGAMVVLGMAMGDATDSDRGKKAELYKIGQTFAESVRAKLGSIVCRELLGLPDGKSEAVPEARTDAYYKKRPCPELVRQASDLIEELLEETACGKES